MPLFMLNLPHDFYLTLPVTEYLND